MISSRNRAHRALTTALLVTLPPTAAGHLIGGTHTRRLSDNLLPGLTQQQVAILAAQLASGAGGELRPTKTGKRPAHAPYSSAALVMNAFGRFVDASADLRFLGLGGFDTIAIESRQRIPHGGGAANLDVLLKTDSVVVGVESKCTETLDKHAPVAWAAPYRTADMDGLLRDGWRSVLDASRDGGWRPAHLGVEQLLKHALALNARFPDRERHLVYLWWEPTNAAEITECRAHRAEIDELLARVGHSPPLLHMLTYDDLFADWARLPPPWIGDHLDQLHARYRIHI